MTSRLAEADAHVGDIRMSQVIRETKAKKILVLVRGTV